jgi:hypothetical protein
MLGGNRRGRIYGRLDCRAALRALARGGYRLNGCSSSMKPPRSQPGTAHARCACPGSTGDGARTPCELSHVEVGTTAESLGNSNGGAADSDLPAE